MWTAICLTRPKREIGSVETSTLASGMPCGTSTEFEVSAAAAMPVPMRNGTLAEPWSAWSASENLADWPHSSELSSCTPNGVVLDAVPAKDSVGYEAFGCGTVTSGVLVLSVPVTPVRSAPGSALKTVSVTASESPGEMMPSPAPPTSATEVESWWMSSAAEAAAGRQRALTAAVSAIVRAARPIGPMAVVSTPSGDPEIWGGFLSRSSRSALAARGLGVVVGDEPTGALAPRARDRRRRPAEVRDHLAGAPASQARRRLGGLGSLLVGGHGAASVAHRQPSTLSIPTFE